MTVFRRIWSEDIRKLKFISTLKLRNDLQTPLYKIKCKIFELELFQVQASGVSPTLSTIDSMGGGGAQN